MTRQATSFFMVTIVAGGCMPDLVVRNPNVDTWSAEKKVGVNIRNLGLARAGASSATFEAKFLPPSGTAPKVTVQVPELSSLGSHDVQADMSAFASAANDDLWATRSLTVVADALHQVNESNEHNNSRVVFMPLGSRLPLVSVDTLGRAVPNEPKIRARLRIIRNAPGTRNVSTDAANEYDGDAGIELRGKSSQNYCKKQYGIETRVGDEGQAVSLLGMPADEDWILQGPYPDKALVRNALAYRISREIGRYAARTALVEAFINDPGLARSDCPAVPSDHYAGVYLWMEKIKRGPGRVAIASLDSTQNSGAEISGGYILKIDKKDDGDVFFNTRTGVRIIHVYPKATKITTQQRQWIQTYFNGFETALYGCGFAGTSGYARYVDVDSFVDFLLLQEAFRNVDGYRISTYMHKDRSEKLKMGPVWDFDIAMGNANYDGGERTDGWVLNRPCSFAPGQIPCWWTRLREDPAFTDKAKARWRALRQGPLATASIHAMIDAWTAELASAQARNFDRWPILGVYLWPNPGTYPDAAETYERVVSQLKTWLADRFAWMDANFDTLRAEPGTLCARCPYCCAYLQTDERNCGACGRVCTETERCQDGRCVRCHPCVCPDGEQTSACAGTQLCQHVCRAHGG